MNFKGCQPTISGLEMWINQFGILLTSTEMSKVPVAYVVNVIKKPTSSQDTVTSSSVDH